jgi:hypothetical protein
MGADPAAAVVVIREPDTVDHLYDPVVLDAADVDARAAKTPLVAGHGDVRFVAEEVRVVAGQAAIHLFPVQNADSGRDIIDERFAAGGRNNGLGQQCVIGGSAAGNSGQAGNERDGGKVGRATGEPGRQVRHEILQ